MTLDASKLAKPKRDLALWISTVIAGAIVSFVVLWTLGQANAEFWRFDVTHDVLPRFACITALAAVAWASARWVSSVDKVGRSTAWWSVSDVAKTPTWDDVRRMTLGKETDDPVEYLATRRPVCASTVAKMTLGWLLASSLVLSAAVIILQGHARTILLVRDTDGYDASATPKRVEGQQDEHPRSSAARAAACLKATAAAGAKKMPLPACGPNEAPPADYDSAEPARVNLNLNGNLTAFLALVAAAVSIIFTHQQLQAKVKADSRQAWIEKLRANIARFIALADTVQYKRQRRSVTRDQEFTTRRLEMELMLNPSEKDHRLLMYLSLKIAFFGEPRAFTQVDDVINLEAAIMQSAGYDEDAWRPILAPVPGSDVDEEIATLRYSDLIGYTMRLAHVVLKREWEQVKATR